VSATPLPVVTLDVSALPEHAFGHRSIMWWATMCMMAIEGTAFALAIASYLYLKGRVPEWPPGVPPPGLLWGTVNVGLLVASTWPNLLAKKAAERFDVSSVRLWMVIALAFAVAFNIVRIFEFQQLNVSWDTNAYGSMTWFLLGLHTTHVLTDLLDSTVLTAVLFRRRVDENSFVDVSENAMYWNFVVVSWLPIYAVIYLAPRVL
jgi:heme/copper-type cytochrome/quinol oxidase subunit 3